MSGTPTTARALLVHGADATWRRAMHDAARDAFRDAGVRVLLSSREAEAAKWLRDPRVTLVVSLDSAASRHAFASVRESVSVLWVVNADVPVRETVQAVRDAMQSSPPPPAQPIGMEDASSA